MNPELCKERVSDRWTWHDRQCSFRIRRDGYCGIHHPDNVKKRRKKAHDMYEVRRKQSSYHQLCEARKEIAGLKKFGRLLLSWVDNWDVPFLYDQEWRESDGPAIRKLFEEQPTDTQLKESGS